MFRSLFRSYFRPGIVCRDGATVSLQASEYHYCTPRNNDGPYTHIEAGYPSVMPPDSWLPYAENAEKPLDTVYDYLPLQLAQEFIDAHGGVVGFRSFEKNEFGQNDVLTIPASLDPNTLPDPL